MSARRREPNNRKRKSYNRQHRLPRGTTAVLIKNENKLCTTATTTPAAATTEPRIESKVFTPPQQEYIAGAIAEAEAAEAAAAVAAPPTNRIR